MGVLKRLPMRHWLKEKLDSREYQGLRWINEERGVFRVAWKHGSRQTYILDRDASVFRAWATYTGRYKNGEKANPKKWKTNFRCALNALPEFEEVREQSHKGVEAHKVYRMKEEKMKTKTRRTKEKRPVENESPSDSEIVELVDEMSTISSNVIMAPAIRHEDLTNLYKFLLEKALTYQNELSPMWFTPSLPGPAVPIFS